jgi:SagB-type dehydrogenase family enzyme
MGAVLDYHAATSVPAGGTDEDEHRFVGARPPVFKDYGNAERLSLATSSAGRLLQDGAGIVRSQARRDYVGGTIHWRAYSSAGALYPVEAYVAAEDGLYSFDALEGALVRLVEGDARSSVAAAAGVPPETASFVVLTGIHARTGWKYLERGYRHVWWDAGTMLANLLAAGERGRVLVGFVDDEVNRALAVDGVREAALAILALGDVPQRIETVAIDHEARPLSRREECFPLAEAAHAATKLAEPGWGSPQDGDLSLPGFFHEPLERILRRRRAIREFAPEAVAADELAALLAWATTPVPADAPPIGTIGVIAHAVDGLASGIYRYDGEFRLLREGDHRRLGGYLMLEQAHGARCAAAVFLLAGLDAVLSRLGGRGYRWAQLEAGIRAGRLQVGAFALGWGATASTFYDDDVSRAFETRESPMLAAAVGRRRRNR